MDSRKKTEEFLAIASEFKLGALITEQPHPKTSHLATLASSDLNKAYKILHDIDNDAINIAQSKQKEIVELARAIKSTIANNNSIYLCGCGATGRLALVLEFIWRERFSEIPMANRIHSFMAGGDAALIKSIENFEDHPEYGERQLLESGFKDGDLLISCTEGGETPFVIGATEAASRTSRNSPFFLYCNPDKLLRPISRSLQVIENLSIKKIELSVGPMALAGSTRMQACSVLMLAVGAALDCYEHPETISDFISTICNAWQQLETSTMQSITEEEFRIYSNGEYVLYEAEPELAISVITDTTERSPTFSMDPFENKFDTKATLSMCYLYFPSAVSSENAWKILLKRTPRTLEWKELNGIASYSRLLGYDFSCSLLDRRKSNTRAAHHTVSISRIDNDLTISLNNKTILFKCKGLSLLGTHLFLKMILNTHSTLVMAKLGRFQDNIMTWVRPSNNKLIDRAIRYTSYLLNQQGVTVSYEKIAFALFECIEQFDSNESLVAATCKKLAND